MTRHLLPALAGLLALGTPLPGADAQTGHHHAGHDHGPHTALGAATIGGLTLAASAAGAPLAGRAWPIGLHLADGQPAPKAIRLWVGTENGRGSAKSLAIADAGRPGGYHAHVAVPRTLPAGSQLWIAVDTADGQTAAALPLPQTATDQTHGPGDGHAH